MINCNSCDRGYCKIVSRMRKEKASAEDFGQICPKRKPLPEFKMSMFEKAMDRHPQGLTNTLAALSMRIVDDSRRPYFRIIRQED